jgi:hypothetical protein
LLFNSTEDDVVGGAKKIRRKLCDLFYKLAGHFEGEGGRKLWLSSGGEKNKDGEKARIAVVEADEDDLL